MFRTVVKLFCEEFDLYNSLKKVVKSIDGLLLEMSSQEDLDFFNLLDDSLGLVIVHVSGDGDSSSVIRLIRRISAENLSIAVLAIADTVDGNSQMALLRSGVVDILARPLDLKKVSFLIEALTLRHRKGWLSPDPERTLPSLGDTGTAPTPKEFDTTDRFAKEVNFGDSPLSQTNPAPIPKNQAESNNCSLPNRLKESDVPSATASKLSPENTFLTASPTMQPFLDQVKRVVALDTTVLIGGETGTGKTRLAQYIHELSPRAKEPFVVVNCGSLTASLIESEMFGHVKGAFPGADRDRTGKFTEAGRGTILLDEINALPPVLQSKLLALMENRVFEPVGSNRSQVMRARIVAVSNKSLDCEVAAGRFRPDLYFRLNVIEFGLPPLRARKEDIPTLAHHFLREFADNANRDIRDFAPDAIQALCAYNWPGNLRELRNAVERAVALTLSTEIKLDDLPLTLRQPNSRFPSNIHTSPLEIKDISENHEEKVSVQLPLSISDLEPSDYGSVIPGHTGLIGHDCAMPIGSRSDSNSVSPSVNLSGSNENDVPEHNSLAEARKHAEQIRIRKALQKHGNNRLRAARELGISRVTLYKKLHEHGFLETYSLDAEGHRVLVQSEPEPEDREENN